MQYPVYLPPSQWSSRYGHDFFTLNVLRYEIVEGTYAHYVIQVSSGKSIWNVVHRFRDFVQLHAM